MELALQNEDYDAIPPYPDNFKTQNVNIDSM